MTAIVGELTDDRANIVLIAGGLALPEEVALAAKRLKALTPLFSKSDPPGALVVPATWSCAVQLAATFGPDWHPQPRLQAWIAEETARRCRPIDGHLSEEVLAALPEGLTPRPYQTVGALEIARTGRALIFDEPRTGKTITTILGLAQLSGHGQVKGLPILVICPASVVDPWVEAFNAWAPYWTAVAWRGPKRDALAGTADVYVTSYDTARIDAHEMTDALPKLDARSLVIDESHYIKNPNAHRTRAVKRLARSVDTFVALSGTPITHHPGDLFPVMQCLEPGANPSKDRWVHRYCETIPGEDYDEEILGLNRLTEPEFRLTIVGQHRRVARADVMADLPPKVYSVRTVELPREWRKAYDDFEQQMYAELPPIDGAGGGELAVMDVLAKFTHLSGLSSAPADVEITYGPDVDDVTGEPKQHIHLELKAPSWKVDALLEILDERCGADVPRESRDQVVAFAPSAQLMKLAGAAAEKSGYRVGYVIGGQTQKDRTEARRAFQAGELDLICATTGAGGTGITLSRAGTLVFLQRPWSLVESLQAEDRAEGDMEATRGTEVIDVVASNTLDTRIRSVLRERAGQLADLVQDPRIVAELLGGSSTRTTSEEAA